MESFIRILIIIFILLNVNLLCFSQYIDENTKNKSTSGYVIVDSLNNGAFVTRRQNFDSSYYFAELAFGIADSIGYNRGKATALKHMGTALWSKGNVLEAKEMYLKSLSIYEDISDTGGIGRIWNNIGLIDITQNNFQNAIDNFEKSILYNSIVKDTVMLATSYLNIGVGNYYLQKFEDAIFYNQKSIKFASVIKDSVSLGNNYSFLGASYIAKSKLKEAEVYFEFST